MILRTLCHTIVALAIGLAAAPPSWGQTLPPGATLPPAPNPPHPTLDTPNEKPPGKTTGKSLLCSRYNFLENMFGDVCWSGMFPIRVAGATMKNGPGYRPEGAYSKVLCKCSGNLAKGEFPKIGFHVGFWAPSRLIDVTRQPMCFASLGGKKLSGFSVDWLKAGANLGPTNEEVAFRNWTMYSAPLIYMLKLLDDSACAPEGLFDYDILHMNILFPNWNDAIGRYTMFLNPELAFMVNPITLAATPIEVAALATTKKPINRLHWIAGNWGPIYPMNGFNGGLSSVDVTSLISVRAFAMLHRLGLVKDTVGESNICERKVRFILRKDAFRWQMVAPSPETTDNTPEQENVDGQVRLANYHSQLMQCTHPTGYPTAGWGMWRNVPGTGEDHSYMVFRWTDCCFGLTPGLQ